MADEIGEGVEPGMQAATELLPVVYAELRRLAAAMAGRLPPGQTLQPTALVHEAYLGWSATRIPAGMAAATSSAPPRRAMRKQRRCGAPHSI